MKAVIDSNECLQDSPRFRQLLDQNEKDLESLEAKLEKVVKQCGQMVAAGKLYASEQEQLVTVLWDMCGHFGRDTVVQAALNRLLTALGEAAKFQAILVDQAARAIARNLTAFIKTELRHLKESRQCFEKVSGELDGVVQRAAGLPRSRPGEGEDLYKQVLVSRLTFRRTALAYMHEISAAQAKKRCNVVDALLSYVKAYSTFFHQGTDLCEDLKPCLDNIAQEVSTMRTDVEQLEHSDKGRHITVSDSDLVVAAAAAAQTDGEGRTLPVTLQGYLFKRANNAFKTWNRRYFTLQGGQLVYRKRSGEEVTVMEEDLRLCSVKPAQDLDRRHCFELLSPNKCHLLQAESEEGCKAWVETLQRGIGAALQGGCAPSPGGELSLLHASSTPSSSSSSLLPSSSSGHTSFYSTSALSPSQGSISECGGGGREGRDGGDTSSVPSKQEVWANVLAVGGNNACCDCGAPDPKWASANLGITLCIECSGIHRSLGVHHSRVKSLTLDDWEPSVLKLLLELGNRTVNSVYAHTCTAMHTPATPQCTRSEREAWIRAKYVQKLFVKPLPASLPPEASSQMERSWSVPRRSRFRRYRHPAPSRHHSTDRAITDATSSSADTTPHTSSQSSLNAHTTASSPTTSPVPDLLASPSPPILVGVGEEGEGERVPLSLAVMLGEYSDTDEEQQGVTDGAPISQLSPDSLLCRAARAHNLPVMCHAVALRASLSALLPAGGVSATPLHHAIRSGSLTAVEYLLLNGAAPNLPDAVGRTPLHLAVTRCSIPQVYRLLQHRSTDLSLTDHEGNKPLDLALHTNQPDLVAILRVASLSEHIDRDEVEAMMQAIMADLSKKMGLDAGATAAARALAAAADVKPVA